MRNNVLSDVTICNDYYKKFFNGSLDYEVSDISQSDSYSTIKAKENMVNSFESFLDNSNQMKEDMATDALRILNIGLSLDGLDKNLALEVLTEISKEK